MPRVSLKRLVEMHVAEKEGKPKLILAACVARKRNDDIQQIARDLGKSYSTVCDWLLRTHGDVNRRYDKKRGGGKSKMDKRARRQLKRALKKDPTKFGYNVGSWQLNLIQEMVRGMNIHLTGRTLRRQLRLMGFSYRKSRPVPRGSATAEEQEAFKKRVNRLVAEKARQGFAVFAQDESHIQLRSGNGYGWRVRGGRETFEASFSKTVSAFGVEGEGEYYIRPEDSCNSETFIKFLKYLLRMHPKILMVMDNAPYHKSKMVREYVKSTNGKLVLVFLPEYAPQLNPMEQQWALLKKLLAGRYFETVDELKAAINSLKRKKQMLPVQLMSCLLAAT